MVCLSQTAEISEDQTDCYEDIPVLTTEGRGSVRPVDRLFLSQSPITEYTDHFGLKIFTSEGAWIQLNPKPLPLPRPSSIPVLHPQHLHNTHADMSVQ